MNDSIIVERNVPLIRRCTSLSSSLSLGFALAFCLQAPSAFSAEASFVQAIADLVPEATPLVILARSTVELEKSWKKSAFFELYSKPVMQPFWDDLKKRSGGDLPITGIGLTWSDLREISPGNTALTLWPTPSKGLSYVLIMDASLKPDQTKALLDLILKKWQKRGYEASTAKTKHGELVVAEIPAPKVRQQPADPKSKAPAEKPAPGPPVYRFAFAIQGRLVICDNDLVIGDIRDRLNGKRPDSLTKSGSFSQIFDQRSFSNKGADCLYWFVDPWLLFRGAVDPKAKSNRAIMRTYNFLLRQGFDAIKAFGGVVEFGTTENEVEYETRVVVNRPLRKGAGLLSLTAAGDVKTPSWLPQSLVEVSSMNLSPESSVKAYGAVYDEIYGEDYEGAFKELLDSIETEPDGPEAFVRRDLFECLQPLVILGVDYQGEKTATNGSGKRQLTIVSTSRPDKSLTALRRFFANDDQIEGHELDGAWIWYSKEPDQLMFPYSSTSALSPKIDAVAIYKQYIIIASDRKLAHEAIQLAAGIGTNKALPAMFANNQSNDVCAKYFRDTTAQFRSNFDLARQGKLHQSGSWELSIFEWLLMSSIPPTTDANIGAKLPNFDDLQSTFGPESREMVVTTSGWTIRGAVKRNSASASRTPDSR